MPAIKALLAVLALAVSLFIVPLTWAADAEPMDLEPEDLAKLAKEKARGTAARGAMMEAVKKINNSDDCGNIEIGNVDTGKKIGFGPRDVTVVITGDVINANNKCK